MAEIWQESTDLARLDSYHALFAIGMRSKDTGSIPYWMLTKCQAKV